MNSHETSHPTPVPEEPDRLPGGLPALGRRGGGWVALQVVVFAVAVVVGVLGSDWPDAARTWLRWAGGAVFVAGVGLLMAGGVGLGSQLTPFPRPAEVGELRQDGIDAFVRHPIYGGVLLCLLAWALVSSPWALPVLALGAIFFDAKRRREEQWLLARYPGYADYRDRVRRRFIPFIW